MCLLPNTSFRMAMIRTIKWWEVKLPYQRHTSKLESNLNTHLD
uniref:Uncharacterized protein n=1 Tax=Arundo donax TaxID=35708 RepID=A0A0A9ALG9_ARUDO